MANKPFNTRIQLKHDTEEHWILATGFSPRAGELIIYDVDATHSSPRFKVGDGTTNVNELPFVIFDYSETDPTVPAWAKAATKPTYTAQEVGALPDSTVIPTKTSDLTNDSGFLTTHQDISGKADKSATVSNVTYDTTNKKITKTINGTTSDVVSAATLKADMSLSNVENKSSATIRSEITSSNVTTALGFTPLNASLKGANNGVAELDASGKVPSSQLPSYVDDVLEYIAKTGFPSTGETGKIYVDTATNKTYRWSGSDYVEISASLALGTTSSTAYRGDYGNAAYAHAVTNKGAAFTSGLYKITTNSEGHVTAATVVEKADITALGIPANIITYDLEQDSSDGRNITLRSSKGDAHRIVTVDTNTHRPIKVNGTPVLGNNTTALDLKAGSNVTITDDGSGIITIAATDTKYTPATVAPGNIASFGAVGTSTNYARQDHTHGISLATGDSNGQVKIAGTNVSVKGLGTNAYIAAPLFITTSNSSASDALTYDTAITLSTGQLVFVTLNKAMAGNANATLKFGSNTAINIYLTGTTQLKAKYAAGTMLGLVYNGTNLYMINPPAAV